MLGRGELEAGVSGRVAEDQLRLHPGAALLQLLADLGVRVARRLGGEQDEAVEARLLLSLHGGRGRQLDQVGAADHEQVVAGAHRPFGLTEPLERAPHHLGDEGEEQSDEQDEPGDDLRDADRALGDANVLVQAGGVEHVQGRRPESVAVGPVLAEGEVGKRGAAEQDHRHRPDEHCEPSRRRFRQPSPHIGVDSKCSRSEIPSRLKEL